MCDYPGVSDIFCPNRQNLGVELDDFFLYKGIISEDVPYQ
jgi:hypothetical protein